MLTLTTLDNVVCGSGQLDPLKVSTHWLRMFGTNVCFDEQRVRSSKSRVLPHAGHIV